MSAPFATDDVRLGMCQTTTLMPKLPFQRIAVSGNSMAPKYNDGDWLIFHPVGKINPYQLRGRVVIFERDDLPGILQIKRGIRVEPVGFGLWVEGDNKSESTDSRHWGVVHDHEFRGVVLFRYKRN